jgi:hypothetical protein
MRLARLIVGDESSRFSFYSKSLVLAIASTTASPSVPADSSNLSTSSSSKNLIGLLASPAAEFDPTNVT